MEKGSVRVNATRRSRLRIVPIAVLLALATLAGCGTKGPLTLTPQPKRACADGSPPPCPVRPPPQFPTTP